MTAALDSNQQCLWRN